MLHQNIPLWHKPEAEADEPEANENQWMHTKASTETPYFN